MPGQTRRSACRIASQQQWRLIGFFDDRHRLFDATSVLSPAAST
jgi:hypothetical protein